MQIRFALFSLLAVATIRAQDLQKPASLPAPQPDPVARYIRIPAGVLVLQHVCVIDGTGVPASEDQTITLDRDKIVSIGPSGSDQHVPTGATVLDLTGRTAFPGLVGMHDHMYYIARPDLDADGHSEPPLIVPQMPFSSPHLYLGAGVTTLRTTGSVEPYTDLNLRREIDAGHIPGPHMDVTGPYLEGAHSPFLHIHQLSGPEDARLTVPAYR